MGRRGRLLSDSRVAVEKLSIGQTTDTFTDADTTLITVHEPDEGMGNWIADVGTWRISGNKLVSSDTGGARCRINTWFSDCTVSADITLANVAFAQTILFRAIDVNYFWYAGYIHGTGYVIGNNFGVQASTAATLTGTHNFSVVLSGSSITLYDDGTPVLSHTSTLYMTATYHGFLGGSSSTSFDNFSVTSSGYGITDESAFYGGLVSTSFNYASTGDGATTENGRTWIVATPSRRIRQNGYVKKIVISIETGGVYKFKVFRPNGSNFDFVSESELFTLPAGTSTLYLASPMPCNVGDIAGVWMEGNATVRKIYATNLVGDLLKYLDSDVTGSNVNFTNSTNDYALNMSFSGEHPELTVTGDSIPEGNSGWHTFFSSTGIDGTIAYEIAHQMWLLNGISYQNHSLGSQTFEWVKSIGFMSALESQATKILIHCGVNDINTSVTWETVLANLNIIKQRLLNGVSLYIDEILPWTNGTDAQAITVRTWNANLAAWCIANGAVLVKCHDAMGKTRVSTGELDDLADAYDLDGVHLTPTGAAALGAIWAAYL